MTPIQTALLACFTAPQFRCDGERQLSFEEAQHLLTFDYTLLSKQALVDQLHERGQISTETFNQLLDNLN